MESPQRVSILLRTFPGLSLPRTVSFSLPSTTSSAALLNRISTSLPPSLVSHLILTTTDNYSICPSSAPISALLPQCSGASTQILPLHLSCPLPGGKGGFGSQLRAAGGRMSSRKRKNALASDPNGGVGSNRNLDGRRLRTVTEAKNLAEYLATKPDLEKREKDERRKRWEAVVEGAERREEEIKKGRSAGGRGKGLSEEWLMEKEDAGERTREAVKKALSGGVGWRDSTAGIRRGSAEMNSVPGGSGSASASASGSGTSPDPSEDDNDQEPMDLDENEIMTLEKEAAEGDVDAAWVLENKVKRPPPAKPKSKSESRSANAQPERMYLGFDDFDDSEEGDDDVDDGDEHSKSFSTDRKEEDVSTTNAKGKQKAIES